MGIKQKYLIGCQCCGGICGDERGNNKFAFSPSAGHLYTFVARVRLNMTHSCFAYNIEYTCRFHAHLVYPGGETWWYRGDGAIGHKFEIHHLLLNLPDYTHEKPVITPCSFRVEGGCDFQRCNCQLGQPGAHCACKVGFIYDPGENVLIGTPRWRVPSSAAELLPFGGPWGVGGLDATMTLARVG